MLPGLTLDDGRGAGPDVGKRGIGNRREGWEKEFSDVRQGKKLGKEQTGRGGGERRARG